LQTCNGNQERDKRIPLLISMMNCGPRILKSTSGTDELKSIYCTKYNLNVHLPIGSKQAKRQIAITTQK